METQDKTVPKRGHDNKNSEQTSETIDSSLTVEIKDKWLEQKNQTNEAVMGLIMLGQERKDLLFDKYNNSELLLVDAACQTDFGQDLNAANGVLLMTENEQQTEGDLNTIKNLSDGLTADNWNVENAADNLNYDSDDTILHELEKEISDVIGEKLTPDVDAPSPSQKGLTVKTAVCDETNKITDQLANLTVKSHPKSALQPKKDGLPVEMQNTPVSPNKGKVVICSYKLRWTVSSEAEKTNKKVPEQDNTENEVLHLKVPSGNATQPPPPDKYKIRKFQIDNVRYYSCMYCNKHFDSIHHLNMHHIKHHPPVSCDVCNKLYDTPNSLIRHSYKHLDGQFKCKTCDQSFHFKSKLDSYSMKHSKNWFYCKKCVKALLGILI